MNKLKPCPFCGGKPMALKDYGAETFEEANQAYVKARWLVRCEADGCIVLLRYFDTEEQALEAWNSRVERTCHAIKEWNMIRSIKGWQCSECGLAMAIASKDEDMPERPDYCPWCGAKVVE